MKNSKYIKTGLWHWYAYL